MAGASSPSTTKAPSASACDAAPRRGDGGGEPLGGRGPHPHRGAGALGHEVGHGLVGDEPAPPDDHEVVGGERHLAHEVAGHEHGAPLGRQSLEQGPHPQDALGVEAVDGLVEEEHARVPEQRGGDAEPLGHAEGELPGPLAGHRGQPHQLEQLVDARRCDVVGLGQGPQVLVGAPPRVHRFGLEQGPDLPQGPRQVVVPASVDGDAPAVGAVEPHDHAHGGGLPRPVGAEKARDLSGPDLEGEVVDRHRAAEVLGQAAGLDHAWSCPGGRPAAPGRAGRGSVGGGHRRRRPRARPAARRTARLTAGGGAHRGRTGRRGRRPRRRAGSCPRPPPSVCPVMKRARSEHRKSTTSATSSGSPTRAAGVMRE